MEPPQGHRRRMRVAATLAVLVTALLFPVGGVRADAPDPILASTSGTIALNADGSRTVTVHGGWTWPTHTSDCNLDRRAVGFAVDWADPGQAGNYVATVDGTAVAVGSAAANAYNPADNEVHASPVAQDSTSIATWRGGCGTYNPAAGHNTGVWGPISHTYGPSFTGDIVVCVLMYDVHLQTNGGMPNKSSEITAGGSTHNPDVSATANSKTPLGNGCFRATISPQPVFTGSDTPPATVTPCPVGQSAGTTSGVRLIPVPATP